MRGLSKAAIFTLGPAIVHSLPVPDFQLRNPNTATDDAPVIWWRDIDGVFVKFGASCPGCTTGINQDWSFELSARSASGTCGNAILTLNGKELTHHWEGDRGSGSGTIPCAEADSPEVSAQWHSVCVQAPPGAFTRYTAQVLTLRLHNVEDRIGFTVSFTNTEQPEILRLSTLAIDIPQSESALEEWRQPRPAERLESQSHILKTGQDPLEARIEQELQKLQRLQAEVDKLRESIKIQEEKIRGLLRQDCQSLASKWEQCRDIGCYFKTSWQTVPEIFRLIKYQFGSLQSQILVPACRSHSQHEWWNTTRVIPPPSQNSSLTSASSLQSSRHSQYPPQEGKGPDIDSPSLFTPEAPVESSSSSTRLALGDITIPVKSETKDLFRTCAIFLLIIAVSALAFRILRNSTAFRRRRVDLAARREERRARRAYNSAARRLRWRQWWEGRSYLTAPSVTSSHSLPQIDHPEQRVDDHYDNDEQGRRRSEEGGAMQAEILGLRRVLEFVGELVRNNDGDDPNRPRRSRAQSRPPPPRYEDVNPAVPATIAASFVMGISTGMNSPRASSLLSLDNRSELTLETLDTLDSGAPPSYRS